jgi:dienelactone hydrolase
MIRLIAFVLVLFTSAPSGAQQPFLIDNQPGPYVVGFRSVEQHDASRSYGQAAARPIQTAIWYPARRGGSPMRYDDYLALRGWDDDFTRTPPQRTQVLDAWLAAFVTPQRAAQVGAERRAVLWAVRDAPAAAGKFPVVVYAPSLSSPAFENAEMMELLASHGYIVLASPALGVAQRTQKLDLAHVEAQAADIGFLIDHARALPQADVTRLAVVGFSFGGLANVVAAAQDARIKALVSLDGTLRYHQQLAAQALAPGLEQLRTPLLFLAQRPAPFERATRHPQDLSGGVLKRLKQADVYLLTMYAMEHPHFATSFLRLDPLEFDEYTRDEVARSHAASGRYVLNFLNGVLKGEPEGLAYLMKKPAQTGMPPHSVHSQLFPAQR